MGPIEILSTALSLFAFLGCLLAYTRAEREADRCCDLAREYEQHVLQIKNERNRISALERDTEVLRNSLRKVSGAFYASLREVDDEPCRACGTRALNDKHEHVFSAPVCENYAIAQREGPLHAAARCDCNYCQGRRAAKAEFREREVPKTAQAQGDLARLNASKP